MRTSSDFLEAAQPNGFFSGPCFWEQFVIDPFRAHMACVPEAARGTNDLELEDLILAGAICFVSALQRMVLSVLRLPWILLPSTAQSGPTTWVTSGAGLGLQCVALWLFTCCLLAQLFPFHTRGAIQPSSWCERLVVMSSRACRRPRLS